MTRDYGVTGSYLGITDLDYWEVLRRSGAINLNGKRLRMYCLSQFSELHNYINLFRNQSLFN